nr:hypothetical transcript [Hymenolepis microstoma]CUU99935.1 hypothetical transcript [Hymenolepis microstoma]
MWQPVVYRCIFGWDSDLEAFSLNPSDGSFAPLTGRPGTYTKCRNLQFLSYLTGLPWQRPACTSQITQCAHQ